MNLTITGTVVEVIQLGKLLEAGLAAQGDGELLMLLSDGRTVDAVKLHRAKTGASLLEAKTYVEALQAKVAAT